jgi:hypothetical protein
MRRAAPARATPDAERGALRQERGYEQFHLGAGLGGGGGPLLEWKRRFQPGELLGQWVGKAYTTRSVPVVEGEASPSTTGSSRPTRRLRRAGGHGAAPRGARAGPLARP